MHGTIETAFRVEWRPLSELECNAVEWRNLAKRAVEPNVFYEPAFALPAARVFGRGLRAGLVWSGLAPQRLLGVFPARIEHHRYGLALPVLVGWTHPYAPLGSPLVDRDCAEGVVAAWLDDIAHDPRLPKLVLLPFLPANGALARALDAASAQRGGRSAYFARHARALLAPAGARATYLEHSVEGKKRKELRRQRRRLAETGSLRTDLASTPDAVAGALEDFFMLEARGWKGRAGTAAHCDVRTAEFVKRAVVWLARDGQAQVARLCLGAQAIAALIVLRSGANAWCWKIAYDEDYARRSPGVQVLLDATESLLRDESIARVDSCATPDHPMIDHIWRERLCLCDRLISPGPRSSAVFRLAAVLERTRRAGFGAAKAALGLVRRR